MDTSHSRKFNPLYHNTELLRQLGRGLEARLQAAPYDPGLLWALGELRRAVGDCKAAAEAYGACAAADPGRKEASLIARLLEGAPSPEDWPEHCHEPVPFLVFKDFLSVEERALLWAQIEHCSTGFEQSRVYKKNEAQLDPNSRVSLVANASDELRAFMLPKVLAMIAKHQVLDRLGLGPLSTQGVEMQVTSHLDAGFFVIHRDKGKRASGRSLTYLWYTHRIPARYTGGDVLFFDEPATSDCRSEIGVTRLVPQDNLLLFFPSDRLHEVTPVTCDSADPLDGRITVNGWFQREDFSAGVDSKG